MPNHQIDKKVLRQDKNFSMRLPYAKKDSRNKFFVGDYRVLNNRRYY